MGFKIIVTNIMYRNKGGDLKKGYGFEDPLVENFQGIPAFLKKDWDVVGIISGHGKVRTGKSTIAFQSAYFIAWCIAGGRMCIDRDDDGTKLADYGKISKLPTKPVNFTLDNVVFTAEDLMETAHRLPPNSVIVYDEGRSGLDSKSAMLSINRVMEDFFQECGFLNHVILIVLPHFFKLHEDYAITRSIFLIDVHHDAQRNKGYYKFYNERQKEKLFFFGKKLIGITAKYTAASPNFNGRFRDWIPFGRVEYNARKKKALDKKRLTKVDARISKQRDAIIYLYKNELGLEAKELSDLIKEEFGIVVGVDVIKKASSNALVLKEKKLYADQEREE